MSMKVENVLHMVGGAGATSYSTNSRLQEKAILRTKHIVEESIKEAYSTIHPENCLVVADLGCSSGPNTFLVISEILNAIGEHCRRLERNPPEIQYLLNDLPENDFNTVFRDSALFKEKKKRGDDGNGIFPYCYIMGVPGSFYGRLFPNQSVHFIHSSYCLHFLSQVPRGLESDIVNKKNIYITAASPPSVITSYREQFERDFSAFLRFRSKELVFGGRMVLTFIGRKNVHASNGELCYLWELLANALNDLVLEGLLEESKLNTFNIPFYSPSLEEVKAVIKSESLFLVDQTQTFESNWDPLDDSSEDMVFDNIRSGENVANCIRAVTEPILSYHFGDAIMDKLYSRYAVNVGKHLQGEKTKYTILVISLKKLRGAYHPFNNNNKDEHNRGFKEPFLYPSLELAQNDTERNQ